MLNLKLVLRTQVEKMFSLIAKQTKPILSLDYLRCYFDLVEAIQCGTQNVRWQLRFADLLLMLKICHYLYLGLVEPSDRKRSLVMMDMTRILQQPGRVQLFNISMNALGIYFLHVHYERNQLHLIRTLRGVIIEKQEELFFLPGCLLWGKPVTVILRRLALASVNTFQLSLLIIGMD